MTMATRTLRDGGIVTWRNLLNIKRTPDAVIAGTIQPIMFVLLFSFVFGNSLGGSSYREFLLAGIFAQAVAFNSAFTIVGIASDLQNGIIDRFRSLPMSRVAMMIGRTSSNLVVTGLGLLVMSLCGLLVGWRIRGSFADAVLAYLLLLLFSFAMSWIGALIGLSVRNPEVAQSAGLIWMFPVTFVSSAFVPAGNMPGVLSAIAEWNPVSALADACRELFGNARPAGFPEPTGWVAGHAALYSLLTSIVIVAVFVPLATARYRKTARR